MSRDCQPSNVPLRKSYFHAVSSAPLVSDTIADVIESAARQFPDHVVFRVPEFQQQTTVDGLKNKVDRASKSLLAYGLKQGDVVLLIGVTDMDFFVLFFAITQIGLIFFSPQLDDPPEKDIKINLQAGPKAIFIGKRRSAALLEVVRNYVCSCKDTEHADSIPVVMVNSEENYTGITPYSKFLENGEQVQGLQTAKDNVSADDIAVLFSSSGTSSTRHRIACVTQHFLVNQARFGRHRVCPNMTAEVIGSLNPISDDVNPVLNAVSAVYGRVVLVLAPTNLTSSPDAMEVFMSFVQNERITWYVGLPLELINAIHSPLRNRYDLTSLRGGGLFGQAVSEEMKRKLLENFPDSLTFFGSTEALAGLSTSSVWSTEEQKLLSSGYPFPHCEIKIVNDRNKIVPIGEQGELCLRGWPVMKHYLGDEELTSQAKDPTKNGWYHYGDICSMDETGHVNYIGRKSECVRFKHFSDTVYPEKILKVIEGDDNVSCAKVVGIPSDEKGDDICLCVEPKPGRAVTLDHLRTLMEEHASKLLISNASQGHET